VILFSDRDLGWVEGFIDGEGSFGVYRELQPKTKSGRTWKVKLTVVNTDAPSMLRVQKILGGGRIRLRRHAGKNWRDTYEIELTSGPIRRMPLLQLETKSQQYALVMEAVSLLSEHSGRRQPHNDRLEQIRLVMKELNQTGRRAILSVSPSLVGSRTKEAEMRSAL